MYKAFYYIKKVIENKDNQLHHIDAITKMIRNFRVNYIKEICELDYVYSLAHSLRILESKLEKNERDTENN